MRRLFLLMFLVITTGTAHAQYFGRNSAVDSALANYVPKSVRDIAQGNRSTATKPAPVKHEPLSASDFKPGKGRPAVDAFFARATIGFMDPKDLRAIVDQTFVVVEEQLRKNNVASALGFVIATSLLIARNTNLEDDALNELVASVNDRVAADASWKTMKQGDRQKLHDELILMGAILITLNALGENNESVKADAMEMANGILVDLGADK